MDSREAGPGISARDWFLFAALLAAMFAPAFLLYSKHLWVAALLTGLIAVVPVLLGLLKLASKS